jgi:RimJ/RimL family protein N-acetyltransferase
MFIKGEKVLLRAIELSDAEILQDMINDEEIERMMWGYSFPVARHQQMKWIENLSGERSTFRAMIDVDGTAVGTIILSDIDMRSGTAEIHIKLAKTSERRKGYGTDAVSALLRYAFNELRLNCVYCRVKEDNIASQKMFEKIGFFKEGCLRERVYRQGRYFDFYEYSVLKSEYIKM